MCRLCTSKEAPAWSVHNTYIHTGYRDTNTFRGAIRSVRTLGPVRLRFRGRSGVSAEEEEKKRKGEDENPPLPPPCRPCCFSPLASPNTPPSSFDRAPYPAVLMIHNETANIWTHLVGLAIFIAITASMVFGWGGTPMPALPDTWVTGANATRVALVARTVQFRENIEASRALLLGLASGLGDGGDQSGGGGLAGGGFGSRIGGAVGEGLDAATSALLHVASGLSQHLHLPAMPLASDARAALHARLDDARSKVGAAAAALARGSSGVIHGLEDAAADAAREAVGVLNHQVRALHAQLESTPDVLEMPEHPVARWPMYVFLVGACVCLSFSSVCHTLACVGARVSSIMWRIDYVGIAVLIVASFYPVVYYSFYCVPGLRDFYLTASTAFGVAVLTVTLMDRFQAPRYTPLRAVLFSSLGACGAFPILHQTLFTWRVVPTPMIVTFYLELLMGACYLLGAMVYASFVPEKWKPGRFDVWLSSHNIFHVLVVMGAYVHYRAALVLMAWRDHHRCDADATLLKQWYVDGGWMGHYGPQSWVRGGSHGGGEL